MGTRAKEEMKKIYEELDALEHQAGIREKALRAREGRFFISNLNETPDEYFDSEYGEIRHLTRRAYFDVPDLDLRRKLIGAERRLHDVWLRSWDEDVRTAGQDEYAARAAADRLPCGMAAVIGGGCVAFGYFVAGLSGAIGGAVVGLFTGTGTIANARADARRNLEAARETLASVEATKLKAKERRETFSVDEQISGELDAKFDRAG